MELHRLIDSRVLNSTSLNESFVNLTFESVMSANFIWIRQLVNHISWQVWTINYFRWCIIRCLLVSWVRKVAHLLTCALLSLHTVDCRAYSLLSCLPQLLVLKVSVFAHANQIFWVLNLRICLEGSLMSIRHVFIYALWSV